jgi:hypothetical protein
MVYFIASDIMGKNQHVVPHNGQWAVRGAEMVRLPPRIVLSRKLLMLDVQFHGIKEANLSFIGLTDRYVIVILMGRIHIHQRDNF